MKLNLYLKDNHKLSLHNAPIPTEVKLKIPKGVKIFVSQGDEVNEGDLLAKEESYFQYFYAPISGIVSTIIEGEHDFILWIVFRGILVQWENNVLTPSLNHLKDSGIYIDRLYHKGFLWSYLQHFKNKILIISTGLMDPYAYQGKVLFTHKQDLFFQVFDFMIQSLGLKQICIFTDVPVNKQYLKKEGLQLIKQSSDYPYSHPLFLAKNLLKKKKIDISNYQSQELVFLALEDIFYIYESVFLKKPFIEKFVFIGGRNCQHPDIYRIKLGTNLAEVVSQLGVYENQFVFNVGGPFFGFLVWGKELYFNEKHSSYLALVKEELKRSSNKKTCIHCDSCLKICPIKLDVLQLYHVLKLGKYELAKDLGVLSCINCGLCSVVCPAYLNLSSLLFEGQQYLLSKGLSNDKVE